MVKGSITRYLPKVGSQPVVFRAAGRTTGMEKRAAWRRLRIGGGRFFKGGRN
jgi:hypothetical protein